MEFSSGVMRNLTGAAWPGNIRQLRNEVMRLAACARQHAITEDDFFEGIPAARPEQPQMKLTKAQSLKKAVAELEQRMIAEALEGTRNNQQQAARQLGLSRQGLINKMKRYALG